MGWIVRINRSSKNKIPISFFRLEGGTAIKTCHYTCVCEEHSLPALLNSEFYGVSDIHKSRPWIGVLRWRNNFKYLSDKYRFRIVIARLN
jgi:hypothetical protein